MKCKEEVGPWSKEKTESFLRSCYQSPRIWNHRNWQSSSKVRPPPNWFLGTLVRRASMKMVMMLLNYLIDVCIPQMHWLYKVIIVCNDARFVNP